MTVSDEDGGSHVVRQTIDVINAAPTAKNDAFGTDEDTLVSIGAAGLLGNDSDVGIMDVLAVVGVDTIGTLGSVTMKDDRSVVYDPNSKFEYLAVGQQTTDSFVYQVSDGDGGYDTATVWITLTGNNDNPVAADEGYSISEDDTLVISASSGMLSNDSDVDTVDALRLTEINGQAVDVETSIALVFGQLTVAHDGSFRYTTSGISDVSGQTETFTYTISDGNGGTAIATVAIAIIPAVASGERTFVGGIVRVGGTDGDDVIVLSDQAGLLYQNGVNTGIAIASIDEIRVWGRRGNDTIEIGNLHVRSYLNGGAGDDKIVGGSGSDFIFGGQGNDHLTGSAGHDFLSAGEGADRLVGSSGNDILVAEEMAIHTTRAEVERWLQLWSDQEVTTEEEEAIDQVFSDDGFDMLTGGSGADWFIVGSGDKITDLKSNDKC